MGISLSSSTCHEQLVWYLKKLCNLWPSLPEWEWVRSPVARLLSARLWHPFRSSCQRWELTLQTHDASLHLSLHHIWLTGGRPYPPLADVSFVVYSCGGWIMSFLYDEYLNESHSQAGPTPIVSSIYFKTENKGKKTWSIFFCPAKP